MRFSAAMAAMVVAFAVVRMSAEAELLVSLRSLTDAERTFAAAARVQGVRDAFLEFFDAEAIALTPHPTAARPRLASGPARPFSAYELTWEPRAGDVASSGDFGWLTGPTTSINHERKDARAQYGSYLSIWRRSPDRPWRVYLDIGINTPGPVEFGPGFTHLQLARRYAGPPDQAAALAQLLEADRLLNTRIATEGLAKGYGGVLDQNARLHRSGQQPISGREAVGALFQAQGDRWQAETGGGAVAGSGDLAYSSGTYRAAAADPLGPYVRIWARDVNGRWWLVLDLAERPA